MSQKDLIFGIRTVLEALKSNKELDKVLISKNLSGNLIKELYSELKNFNVPYQIVNAERIDRITKKNHQGVIAYCASISYKNIEELVPQIYENGRLPFLLILDHITDVRNFGAIARTAECAGVDAIIIPDKGAAEINADAIKTSAGALHNIPVCRSNNFKNTFKFLKDSGIFIIAASEKAENTYFSIDLTMPLAIMLGSEEKGIAANNLKVADQLAKIPLFGKINSLNVSVASAIFIYEAVRQRRIV